MQRIGLDSGCVYGRQLSTLVLPKSSSHNLTSPLAASSSSKLPGVGAFRHFDKDFTLSHPSVDNPYGSFAPKKASSDSPSRSDSKESKRIAAKAPKAVHEHRRVKGGMKKVSKRAPPPAGGLEGWLARPGVKGWSAEPGPAPADEDEDEPVEEDGDVEAADVVDVDEEEGSEVIVEDGDEDEDEERYEEIMIEFAGRSGWIVSRDCRADAEDMGLEIKSASKRR